MRATLSAPKITTGSQYSPQMADRVVVRDNTSERRYEMFVDGKRVGLILYRRRPGAVAPIHTEIEPQFEVHGLGARLVKGAAVG